MSTALRSMVRRLNQGGSTLSNVLQLVLGALLLASPGAAAFGQVLYGSMVGVVTDATGAVVPGAGVEITNLDTGDTRRVQTNGSGTYDVPNLQAGRFSVSVLKTGFSTFKAPAVVVGFNTQARVDAVLNAGSDQQVISVSADQAALQGDLADVHLNVTTKELEDLPQATRTYQGLVGLAPGVNPPNPSFAGGGGTNNPGRSMIIEANGTSSSGTDVRIDGVSAVNPWVQFYSSAVPSTEAIETVNVVTSSPDAEQGLASGATVNVQIKSGTNTFHGSAYELYQGNALNAKPYFLSKTARIPKLVDNDFGGTIGGPILKEKLFFFGSYEGDLNIKGNSNTASLPTGTSGPNGGLTGIRAGDFSGTSTIIYDPAKAVRDANGNIIAQTPFPGNKIPAAQLSPITQKLVALIPSTNFGAAGSQNSNYFAVTPNQYNLHKIDTKLTWQPTSKLRLAARYSQYPYNGTQSPVLGQLLGGGNPNRQYGDTFATTVSASYVVTSRLVVDGSWGFTRSHQFLVPPRSGEKVGSDTLGIPGVNLGDLPAAGGLPNFNINGYTSYGYSYPYLEYNDPVFQYAGNVSWSKGAHNIKAGTIIAQQHMNHLENNPTYFGFNGGKTAGSTLSNPRPAITQANAFADFLLGYVNNRGNSQNAGTVTLHTLQYSFYVRDQWQINRRLTLSYGTGYEYYPVPNRGGGRGIERFDFNTNSYLICGTGGTPQNCGIDVEKNLFTPRVGFAFRPSEKSVIRAGFGISREQLNQYRDGLYSFPVRLNYQDSATSDYAFLSTVNQGIPLPAAAPSGVGSIPIAQLPAGVTFTTNDQKFVRGYVESFNFTTEHDFGHGWLGQVGYVGTHTIHQHSRFNANAGMVLGANAQGQFFYNLPTGPGKTLGITAGETVIRPLEAMTYNSLQAQLNRSFNHGLQLHAAYTWAKWIAICCDTSGDGGPAIDIPQYFKLNRAASPGDLRHNFVLSAIYELPLGKGKMFLHDGLTAAIVGGWQVNGLFAIHTGFPFSVTANGASLGAPGNTQRADLVKPVRILGAHDGANPYFDRSSFADPTVTIGTGTPRFGTSSFNNVYGPGYGNLDLSLFRNFALYDRFRLQAKADALNLTNHPNFSNPSDTNVSDSGYGVINSANPGSRLIAERNFRLGLKLSF